MKKKRKKTHNDSDKAFLNTLTMETGFPRVPLEMTSRKKVNKRCHQMSNFKAKMYRFDFGQGFVPEPNGGAYSAPQIFYSWI